MRGASVLVSVCSVCVKLFSKSRRTSKGSAATAIISRRSAAAASCRASEHYLYRSSAATTHRFAVFPTINGLPPLSCAAPPSLRLSSVCRRRCAAPPSITDTGLPSLLCRAAEVSFSPVCCLYWAAPPSVFVIGLPPPLRRAADYYCRRSTAALCFLSLIPV